MGVVRVVSKDSYPGIVQSLYSDRNPDPANYVILETYDIFGMLIVKIRYPNCTNYEGVKLLAYVDVTLEQLKKQKLIDPHFSNNPNFISPVARFEPTERGLEMAIKFATIMRKK
jgi:hypothetical protein